MLLTMFHILLLGLMKDITETQIPANSRVFAPGGGTEPRDSGLSKGSTMAIL